MYTNQFPPLFLDATNRTMRIVNRSAFVRVDYPQLKRYNDTNIRPRYLLHLFNARVQRLQNLTLLSARSYLRCEIGARGRQKHSLRAVRGFIPNFYQGILAASADRWAVCRKKTVPELVSHVGLVGTTPPVRSRAPLSVYEDIALGWKCGSAARRVAASDRWALKAMRSKICVKKSFALRLSGGQQHGLCCVTLGRCGHRFWFR